MYDSRSITSHESSYYSWNLVNTTAELSSINFTNDNSFESSCDTTRSSQLSDEGLVTKDRQRFIVGSATSYPREFDMVSDEERPPCIGKEDSFLHSEDYFNMSKISLFTRITPAKCFLFSEVSPENSESFDDDSLHYFYTSIMSTDSDSSAFLRESLLKKSIKQKISWKSKLKKIWNKTQRRAQQLIF